MVFPLLGTKTEINGINVTTKKEKKMVLIQNGTKMEINGMNLFSKMGKKMVLIQSFWFHRTQRMIDSKR